MEMEHLLTVLWARRENSDPPSPPSFVTASMIFNPITFMKIVCLYHCISCKLEALKQWLKPITFLILAEAISHLHPALV